MKIIYTDLDGTLLDHNTYSFTAALPALQQCATMNIPVIFNTSKTFEEVQSLQRKLHLTSPFIVENGAAVYIPKTFAREFGLAIDVWIDTYDCTDTTDYLVKVFAQPNTHWQSILAELSHWHTSFKAVSQISTDEVSKLTGLHETQAQGAQKRQYGEPLFWLGTDTEKQAFINEIKHYGAVPIQGGRFLHINGDTNKGSAQHWLTTRFKSVCSGLIQTIGLGDGMNDIPLLENADIAVQIKSPAYDYPPLNKTTNIIKTKLEGPAGWNHAILELCAK